MEKFSHYIRSGQKLLRCGYTTGTCAALAAAGAVHLLLTGTPPEQVSLTTPKGIAVTVPLTEAFMQGDTAVCAVVKDGGDDSDVTSGLHIRAAVTKSDAPGVRIDGGEGVGRVTKPGLDQPVGAAAINRVPRRMIAEQVRVACEQLGYTGGIDVLVSVPNGQAAAARTFNPMLGITGGISILGTSGVVEPMSEQALIDTIAVQLRQAAVNSKRVILTPGNYGEDFLRGAGLKPGTIPTAKCSNFIGEALDIAAAERFEQVLLVGHIGKFVKLAGGVMNTHSRYADCRAEIFCAHAAINGAEQSLCRALMSAATTDACIALLEDAGLREPVLASLLEAVQSRLEHRAAGAFLTGAVLFSNRYGVLGVTEKAKEIINLWNKEKVYFTV